MSEPATGISTLPQAPAPAAPARRARKWRLSRPRTRQQKIVFAWLTIMLGLLALLPIASFLAVKMTAQQQAKQAQTLPVLADAATVIPLSRDPERKLARFIDQMVSQMSLDEELGQMIVAAFIGDTLTPDLEQLIVNGHIGTVILYGGNVQSAGQTQALDAAIQAHAKIPLFISSDQEGGLVNRLLPITGERPSAEALGATNDPQRAFNQGVDDGKILSELGINLNLAPVVDVQTVSDSATVIPTRMFGTTPDKVTTFAGAYLEGMQGQGVIGCIKHWPGLGAATVDPHAELPVFNRSRDDLNAIDFAPYRALIARGDVDMVMTTHELVPAYDPNLPASISPIMIDQVLRQQIGYQGVIVTDGLHMGALSWRWNVYQAMVLAVVAGDDMLLSIQADELPGALAALHEAIDSGQITKARIDQSVERILALKVKYGLIKTPPGVPQG